RVSPAAVLRGGLGGLGCTPAQSLDISMVTTAMQVRQLGGLGGLEAVYFRALPTSEPPWDLRDSERRQLGLAQPLVQRLHFRRLQSAPAAQQLARRLPRPLARRHRLGGGRRVGALEDVEQPLLLLRQPRQRRLARAVRRALAATALGALQRRGLLVQLRQRV